MASANRPARLNRTLLFVIAVVLLAAAVLTLLVSFGVLADLGISSPAATDPLTPSSLSLPSWAAYLSVAAAAIVGLLCLRWLAAQAVRRPPTGLLRLETDPAQGTTRLDGSTAVDPLVEEIENYPGVHRASARLSGTISKPVLHLVIGTEDAADVIILRRRIDTEAIPRLRQALDLPSLPADLTIRLDDARSARLT